MDFLHRKNDPTVKHLYTPIEILRGSGFYNYLKIVIN